MLEHSTLTTWRQVLSRKSLVGGDIRWINSRGATHLGRIAEMKQTAQCVQFMCAWIALHDSHSQVWKAVPELVSIDIWKRLRPEEIEHGTYITVSDQFGNYYTIYPKGKSILDSSRVHQLPPDWERLLRLYPNLLFDRTLALDLCQRKEFQEILSRLSKVRPQTQLVNVLRNFPPDVAEQFLQQYIERVTGEGNIAQKVY